MGIGMCNVSGGPDSDCSKELHSLSAWCVCQGLLMVTGVDIQLLISPIRDNVVALMIQSVHLRSALIFPV